MKFCLDYQHASFEKSSSTAGGPGKISNLVAEDNGCESPQTGGDLIRAHNTSSAVESAHHQDLLDSSGSELGSPSDIGYASDETMTESVRINQGWTGSGEESLLKQLQHKSPSRVTGFDNPMYSNHSRPDESLEENPIFEM